MGFHIPFHVQVMRLLASLSIWQLVKQHEMKDLRISNTFLLLLRKANIQASGFRSKGLARNDEKNNIASCDTGSCYNNNVRKWYPL